MANTSLNENLRSVFVSLLTSTILFAVLYFIRLKNVEEFIPRYGFFILISIIAYAIILPSVKQVKSYVNFSTMGGMMIGMTFGMVAGFMPGFIIGSTNGIFYGSIFGIAIGVALGIWNGKHCGVMGIMEGIMAGFMGGLMGAMTGVMMLNDNLKVMAIILLILSTGIMVCLSYMIQQEKKKIKKDKEVDELQTIAITFILTTTTIWLMTFGPRSVLFQ